MTKWQHHILCWIKIFYISQIKVKNSIAEKLFPPAGQKRMKKKTKKEKEKATETI